MEHQEMLIPYPYIRRLGFIAFSIIECFNAKVKSKWSDTISILNQIQKVSFENLISNYKNYLSDLDLGEMGIRTFSP